MRAEECRGIRDDMHAAIGDRADGGRMRRTQQDRHLAIERAGVFADRHLGIAAQHFQAAFDQHIGVPGLLAFLQQDGPRGHGLDGNIAAMLQDLAHRPALSFRQA